MNICLTVITAFFGLLAIYAIGSGIVGVIKSKKRMKEEALKRKEDDYEYIRLCSYNKPSRVIIHVIMSPDKRVTLYKGSTIIGTLMAIRNLEDKDGNRKDYLSIFSHNQVTTIQKSIGLDIPIDSPILRDMATHTSGFIQFSLDVYICTDNAAHLLLEDDSIDNCIAISVNRMTSTMTLFAKQNGSVIDNLVVNRCNKKEANEMFIYYLITMRNGSSTNPYISTGMSKIDSSSMYGRDLELITIGCGFDPNYVSESYYYDY